MPELPPIKKFVSNTGVRIYRIPCQVFESLSGRVYLLLGAGQPTLVDAGSGLWSSTKHILAGLQAVRDEFGEPISVSDIQRIIITHGHVDHIGGLPELLELLPAQVAIHILDRGYLASHHEYIAITENRLGDFFRQAGVDTVRRAELLKAFHYSGKQIGSVPVAKTLADGEILDGLRMIHTPGHSPGHVCIGVGNILLSGDHIMAQTVPQQWPELMAPFTGLGHYLESLAKIERMQGFELTLPAHEQVIQDVYRRIESIRAAHIRRLDRLLTMLAAEPKPLSIYEISQRLYQGVTGFRAVLAVTDVGARVDYLHQRCQLSVVNYDEMVGTENAVYRYCVP